MNGIQVFNKITHITHNLRVKYLEIKIIFSEITPGNDERDREDVICNRMLNSYAPTQETYSLFRDNKHIRENKIAKFASNIKIALRQAYGNVSIGPRRNKSNEDVIWVKIGKELCGADIYISNAKR